MYSLDLCCRKCGMKWIDAVNQQNTILKKAGFKNINSFAEFMSNNSLETVSAFFKKHDLNAI